MSDVINPDDVNFYRQIVGGVTTAQLLHGSANPIGGENVFVKMCQQADGSWAPAVG